MYTSFLTLSLMLAPVLAIPDRPNWQSSYSAGLEAGLKEGKPLAVFVGSGPQGQAALVKEGQFSADMLKILAQKYICVYLDRSQTANQRLVRDFGITLAGVVVSDKTGSLQAFHQDGVIAQADLTRQLRRFADPNVVISTTVSNTSSRVSFYNGSSGSSSTFSGTATRTVNC